MKHSVMFGMAAWVLTVSCPSLDLVKDQASARVPASRAHAIHSPVPGEAVDARADFSIYNLASSWTDQDGVQRPLSNLRGRVQLIALVYTHCGYACPRIVQNMKRIEAQVPHAGFVLVSIDPERDTPNRLREFAEAVGLDASRYTLLSGSDADLLELAAVLGVRYRKVGNGEFVHSNVISVLDRDGTVVHQQIGFDTVDETIATLQRLVAKTAQ